MNTSSRKVTALSAACGLILIAAASSTIAQQPRSTSPGATSPGTTAPGTTTNPGTTAPGSTSPGTVPGTTRTPSPAPTPVPPQTTPNPAPTQTIPNPSPTQTIPNPSPTQTIPNPSPTQTFPNPSPTDAPQNRPTTITPVPSPFSSLDSNTDTRISVEEFNGPTLGAFKSMDRNGDGRITGVEVTDAQPASLGLPLPLSSMQINEFDADRDTQLTDTEISNGVTRLFRNMDRNGDGFVSEAELNGTQSQIDKEVGSNQRNTDTTDTGVNRSR
jgi:Ca2+-binding EF-hand superfamily protein